MKKVWSILILCVAIAVPAVTFADMGAPQFTYEVYVNLSGWSLEMSYISDVANEDGSYWANKTMNFSPGTKLQIGYFDASDEEYMVEYDVGGADYAMTHVSKQEINSHTIESGSIIGKEKGSACELTERMVNTDESDLTMRIGPARGFPSRCGIPKGTELTYEYTYKNGDTLWAFVSYNGKEGWVNSAYLCEIPEEEPVIESVETDVAVPPADEPETETVGYSRNEIIAASVGGALIVAITALIIILLIKRKRNS